MKIGFQQNPQLEFLYLASDQWDFPPEIYDGRHAVLLNNIVFVSKNQTVHTARRHQVTDGGSIPKALWWSTGSPFTYVLLAFLIHDEECGRARSIMDKRLRKKMRLEADRLLREMILWISKSIKGIKISRYDRFKIYRGVRLGAGWDEVKFRFKSPQETPPSDSSDNLQHSSSPQESSESSHQ